MKEVPLAGGALTEGVVRIGDTVRRPVQPGSSLMQEVLDKLADAGFSAAPRWLGLDEQGRVILTWLAGETFTDRGRLHPFLGPGEPIRFERKQLEAVFSLLRRFHDAAEICHGDFGPWNLVWREGLPTGVIDFDALHHGEPSEDVAYALRTFISYGLVAAEAEELALATSWALAAYGKGFDVPRILDREFDRAERDCLINDWPRALERIAPQRSWLAANRALF